MKASTAVGILACVNKKNLSQQFGYLSLLHLQFLGYYFLLQLNHSVGMKAVYNMQRNAITRISLQLFTQTKQTVLLYDCGKMS